jgi:hypothetical protein
MIKSSSAMINSCKLKHRVYMRSKERGQDKDPDHSKDSNSQIGSCKASSVADLAGCFYSLLPLWSPHFANKEN